MDEQYETKELDHGRLLELGLDTGRVQSEP